VSELEIVVLADVQVVQVALQDGQSRHVKDRNEGTGNHVREQEDEDAWGGWVNLDWGCHWWQDHIADHGCHDRNEHLGQEHEGTSDRLHKAEFGGVL